MIDINTKFTSFFDPNFEEIVTNFIPNDLTPSMFKGNILERMAVIFVLNKLKGGVIDPSFSQNKKDGDKDETCAPAIYGIDNNGNQFRIIKPDFNYYVKNMIKISFECKHKYLRIINSEYYAKNKPPAIGLSYYLWKNYQEFQLYTGYTVYLFFRDVKLRCVYISDLDSLNDSRYYYIDNDIIDTDRYGNKTKKTYIFFHFPGNFKLIEWNGILYPYDFFKTGLILNTRADKFTIQKYLENSTFDTPYYIKQQFQEEQYSDCIGMW